MNSRDPTCSSPLQSHATDKSVRIIASTCRSGNHNFLVLKHQVIPVLLSPDALAFFPLLVECPYSHRILCKPSDLFGGLLSDYSYMAYSMCQLDSSCEIPSMPLDDLCYRRQPPLSPCQYNLIIYIALCFPLGRLYM